VSDIEKRTRLMQLFHGESCDRSPVAFWHHFYPEGDASKLAYTTAKFYKDYDADFAKIMPDIPFMLPDNSIQRDIDWSYISLLSFEEGNAAQYVRTVKETRKLIGSEAVLLTTVFSPLAYLQYFIGLDRVSSLEGVSPTKVHRALATIAQNVNALCREISAAGADGIYYSVWGSDILSAEAYCEFGRPYDLLGFEGARGSQFNILHVHGTADPKLQLFKDYPAEVVSWSTFTSGIDLLEGKEQLGGKIPMGGITELGEHLVAGTEIERVVAEGQDASSALSKQIIVAPGCSLPDAVSSDILRAIRKSVG
jgi:uroporphyrinogen-III decarboxylase